MIAVLSIAVSAGLAAAVVLVQRRQARRGHPAPEPTREERQSIRATQQAANARHGRDVGRRSSHAGEQSGMTGS